MRHFEQRRVLRDTGAQVPLHAITLPLHYRYISVTLPLRVLLRDACAQVPLHTITLPFPYRSLTVPLPFPYRYVCCCVTLAVTYYHIAVTFPLRVLRAGAAARQALHGGHVHDLRRGAAQAAQALVAPSPVRRRALPGTQLVVRSK